MRLAGRITHATGVDRGTGRPVEFRARTFVMAGGYVWSSHLLLCSAAGKYPNGLANGSGLVGKYLTGHRNVNGFVSLPLRAVSRDERAAQPGDQEVHAGAAKAIVIFATICGSGKSSVGREPRLTSQDGRLLLGDELLTEWRSRAVGGYGAGSRLLRRHSRSRERPDARLRPEHSLGRPASPV